MKKTLFLCVAFAVALSSVTLAGNNPETKVAVHVKNHNPKQNCTTALPVIATCQDILTTYPGFSFDAFPVFFDLVEYLGVEYGMCWPTWTYGGAFTSCSDLIIGDIQNPGDGVSQTWTACRPGPVAIAGWLWLYADNPGLVTVCPHPLSAEINVLDCAEGLDEPKYNYSSGVFGFTGDDPCEPIRTEPTTWGAIKGMFK